MGSSSLLACACELRRVLLRPPGAGSGLAPIDSTDPDQQAASRKPEASFPFPRASLARGTQKKKVTDPYVVGWFLGGQKSTRAGQIFFREFFIVFLNSPHRETPKNVIKENRLNREKIGLGFFCRFFCKSFRHDFFVKCQTFFVVFLNSHR
jgi:hypothetical protein